MFAYAAPHVVGDIFVVVQTEDVPALHEGSVASQQGILHVLEVILGHLVVHLVLETLQVANYLTLSVHLLHPPEKILFGLLAVLASAQKG